MRVVSSTIGNLCGAQHWTWDALLRTDLLPQKGAVWRLTLGQVVFRFQPNALDDIVVALVEGPTLRILR